ncbi:MAG: bifunctional phosphoglucose/phosphomannose isomerase [Actinomycetota bacterium]|nr:bifunctional phosphoglucose/phosphomannose isomerase [Actinomycetota bacterium]
MIDLDDVGAMKQIDSEGMLETLSRFPEQIRHALDIGSSTEIPEMGKISNVIVLGMGGSGISGDIVANLPESGLFLPCLPVKGYELPEFVGENSLVFAVSYSGNTEETLTCVEKSIERKAKIIAITSGGKLLDIASSKGLPVFHIASGFQPRAALAYLFVPIVCALEKLHLIKDVTPKIKGSISLLEARSKEFSPGKPVEENPTKRLAKDLFGYMPVVYGSEGPNMVVAERWKCQFNENSKVLAFYNSFPELNHNETVGWQNLESVWSLAHLIFLRDSGENKRVSARIEITMELIGEFVGRMTQVFSRGENGIERMLDIIYFGDFTSAYLAIAYGTDPTPVTRIEELKKRLGVFSGE